MSYLPYVVAGWLFLVGLYGVVSIKKVRAEEKDDDE